MLHRISITIPSGSVSETLANFPLYIDLSTLPSSFWDGLVYDSGADIRIRNPSYDMLPFDLVYISKLSHTGCLIVKVSLSYTTDTVIYLYFGNSNDNLLDVTDPYGRNAVWSDYHRVFFFGDYLHDRTGSGNYLNYTNLYNNQLSFSVLSSDIGCHQGCAYDGTYYYAIGTNLLRKYNSSWTLIEENTDPCGDAGGGVTHNGGGFVMNGILYITQTTEGYTVTQLSEFNTSDLSFVSKRNMSAPGGVYWTSGVSFVPEWNQFVFCEYYNDGTKLFLHNNDLSLTYAGSITLSSALTQLQGITYWRGAFWVSRDNDDFIYRINRDGSEIIRMGSQSSYTYTEGITFYGDYLYLLCSNSTTHGVITRLSLPSTIDGVAPGLYLNDTTTPDHRAIIAATRFTQWTIGIGQQLVYRKSYQNHVIGYGLSTATDNVKRETVTWTALEDVYNLYNSDDGLLRRDPLSTTPACTYKTAFSGLTVDVAPSGWTERWNTTAGAITIRNDGVFGNNCLETTATSSSRYAASIDELGTSVTDCEVLVLIRQNGELANIARVLVRGGGSTGSENCYWAYLDGLNELIGIHKYVAGTSTSVGNTSMTIAADTWYYMRFRVVGTSLKLKVWEKSVSEPVNWNLEFTDSSLSSGWIGVGRASVNTQSVDYDYFAVDVDSNPITVPLPVTDIGNYARIHVTHNGTTERKLFYNNTVYTDSPCAEKPASDADCLMIGYNDADYQYGTDGHLTYLYLRNSVLSENWIVAENNNLSNPSSFYALGSIEDIETSINAEGDFRPIKNIYVRTDNSFNKIIDKFVRTETGWNRIL